MRHETRKGETMTVATEIITDIKEAIEDLYDQESGVTLTATGDTYDSRRQLKHLGFEWDGTMKEWRTTVYRINDNYTLWAKPVVITQDELIALEDAGVEFTVED